MIRPEFEFARKFIFKGLKLENENLGNTRNLKNIENLKNTGNSENKNTEQDELSPEGKKWLNRFTFIFGVYILFLLSVFIIPTDILDKCQICANFTNFMKQFIPSIEIFGSTSKIPQVVMFYVSYISIISVIVFIILLVFWTFLSVKYNVEYFKSLKDFIKSALFAFLLLIAIYWLANKYFSGTLVLGKIGIFAKDFYPTMSSRLEILYWTFQVQFATVLICALIFSMFFSAIILNTKNQINKFF